MRVCVYSHHKRAGGKPLDSLWYSQDALQDKGVYLDFVWTGTKRYGIRSLINADVVIFDGINSLWAFNGTKIFKLCRLLKKRIVVYWHETEWILEKALKTSPFVNQVINDRTVFHIHVCEKGKESLIVKHGIHSQRIQVVPVLAETWLVNDIMSYPLPLPFRQGLFVCCGFVGYCKGHDYFMDIAASVIRERKESLFIWGGSAGEDVDMLKLRDELFQRKLAEHVMFIGNISNPVSLMSAAEAILLPSRSEGMPKLLFEAMLLGKPCVAFDAGGIREQLGDIGGACLPQGDIEVFSDVLIKQSYALDGDAQKKRRQWVVEAYGTKAYTDKLAMALQCFVNSKHGR